jgi:hypothetical protein
VNVGSVDVGKPSTAVTVTITNNGTAAGTLTVTPSGVTATGCTGSLSVNASCTLSIIATPTVAGTITGTVTVAATGGNAVTIGVTGTAYPPGNFTVDKTVIDLGNLAIGQAAQATVTVTAGSTLTGLTTAVVGTDIKTDAASTCTTNLAAGLTCTVVVDFSSTTPGAAAGDAITIAQGGVTKTIPVSANVLTLAKLGATPNVGSLTAVPGAASSPLVINVGNTGGMTTGQLTVLLSGANAADFKISADTCSIVTLAASATCSVTVNYSPAATVLAAETATLTIADKGTGASSATVALTGIPTLSSVLTITGGPSLGTVAPGSSGAEVLFTVTNTAATPTGVLTASVNPSTSITISSNTCATKATLNKGDTCTVGLKLTPAAAAVGAAVSAILTVSSATDSANISVTGNVVPAATAGSLSASSLSLDFGSIRVGKSATAQTVTIKNVGGSPTGALSLTKSGTFFGDFPIASNTCTGAIAAGASCAIGVSFTPTATGSESAGYTLTDGVTSLTIAVSGVGLAATGIDWYCDSASSTTASTSETFGTSPVVVGSTVTAKCWVKATTTLPVGVTDTGAITITKAGTNADQFTIASNGCTTALIAGASCEVDVSFVPTVASSTVQATLGATTVNGGASTLVLSGQSVAVVSITANTVTDESSNTSTTGLFDFGQVSLDSSAPHYRSFTVKVYQAAETSTTASVGLTDGATPANFRNAACASDPNTFTTAVTASCASATANPCNAAALTFASGAQGSSGPAANWTCTGACDGAATENTSSCFCTCNFDVMFSPQGTAQGPETATLNASESAGSASATQTLTGTAAGALTFSPSTASFPTSIAVGSSSNQANTTVDGTTYTEGGVTFTLQNNSTTAAQGPVTIALGGTNPGQFAIVKDTCTGTTLTVAGGATPTCTVIVAFLPTATGSASATITATAGTVTASATVKATATTGSSLALSTSTVDFGTVAQTASAWIPITVSNPSATASGPIVYVPLVAYGSNSSAETDGGSDFVIANGSNHAYGTCGQSGTTSLAANGATGSSCTIFVGFFPTTGDSPFATSATSLTRQLTVTDISGVLGSAQAKLSGKVASQLAITPATYGFPDTAVGVTSSTLATVTVTNNGATPATVSIVAGNLTIANASTTITTVTDGSIAPFSVAASSVCVSGTTTLQAGGTCVLVESFVALSSTYVGDVATQTISVQSGSISATGAGLALSGKTVKPATLIAYGVGTAATWAASVNQPIHLGAVRYGEQSGAVTLVYKNTGSVATSALNYQWDNSAVNNPEANNEFVINNEVTTSCFVGGGISLNAGATCTVTIHFLPSSTPGEGVRTRKLTVAATNGGTVQAFELTATALTNSGESWITTSDGTTRGFFAFTGTTPLSPTTAPAEVFTFTNSSSAPVDPTALLAISSDSAGTTPATCTGSTCTTENWKIDLAAGTAKCSNYSASSLLGAGGSCTFSVAFNPTAAYDATNITNAYRWATIGSPALGVASLGVFGQVQAPAALTLTPSALAFGDLLLQSTTPMNFTVSNTGATASAALTITSSNTTYYVVGGTCAAILPAGQSCVGTVTAQPGTTIGSLPDGTLTITDGGSNTVTSTLTAAGTYAATLGSLTSTLALGSNYVGAASPATGTLSVTNIANAQTSGKISATLTDTVNFTLVNSDSTTDCLLGADFGAASPAVGVPGGESCTLKVKFTPQSAGAMSTTLTITGTPGGTVKVTVTGTGMSNLVASPTTVTGLPAGYTNVVPITITNNGSSTTPSLKASISGANFYIAEDGCTGAEMVVGGTCTVQVEFVGTATTTAFTGTLTVTDGKPATANSVSVSIASATSS